MDFAHSRALARTARFSQTITSNPSSPAPDAPGAGSSQVYGSAHHGGFMLAYADGHVTFIDYSVDLNVFTQEADRNGN